MTMVDVSLSSHMTPTMISTKPTSSQDEKPRFLSQRGAANCALGSGVIKTLLFVCRETGAEILFSRVLALITLLA
jgi:hypothetical protein